MYALSTVSRSGYRPNRSTDDAIATTLHTYVRMLFIDNSSALNTIVPSKLITKLEALGLNPILCNWVLDILTGHPQVVKVGNNTSTSLILNTGDPQGCVLSPLLYSLFTHDCVAMDVSNSPILNTAAPQGCVVSPLLYSLFTHDCVAMHASNSIVTFADDTTVVGLITNNDETAYR